MTGSIQKRLAAVEARVAARAVRSAGALPTLRQVADAIDASPDAAEICDLARARACGSITPAQQERLDEICDRALVKAFGEELAARVNDRAYHAGAEK